MSDSRHGPAGEPDILVLPGPEDVSLAAAEWIATTLGQAVAGRGRADFATTGGSTPIGIYRHLAADPLRRRVPWTDVHVWWGDDRFVPRDHQLSNVLPADTILFAAAEYSGQSGNRTQGTDVEAGIEPGVPVPAGNIHPFPCSETIGRGGTPADCARTYAEALAASPMPVVDGLPRFDLILVGVGPDGHVMSVFPGSRAFDCDALAFGIPAPTHVEPHVERVTLSPALLGVASRVLVVAYGATKAGIIGRAFGEARDPRSIPAQLTRRVGATWILDAAAAAQVPPAIPVRSH